MAVVKKERDKKGEAPSRESRVSVVSGTSSQSLTHRVKRKAGYAGVFLSKEILDRAKKTTENMAGNLTQDEKNTFVSD